jgi:hypothetical protein
MGYLNNNVVTVDAILTKKGRELLARGASSFNITQFALADDEIDYDLWNQSHPLGDDKMGIVIENLPITEAVPDETQSMKYKLITLSEGTKSIPYIEATPSSLNLTFNGGALDLTPDDLATNPNLKFLVKQWNETGGGGSALKTGAGGYTFTILDTTYFTVLAVNEGVQQLPMSGKSVTWNTTADNVPVLDFVIGINGDWQRETLDGKSTKMIVTNTRYGSRIVVPISFSNV